ncbi:hypothetical protein SE17_00145 [Kouleothrix aurantiaca]|uniref:Uncharacterized protein n=1 Tax=Kouleothrix aurantiaca TaxID=186479 RepID=A0A0N8PTB3_9CHLR|nr:hypothetical protein SE17_00145 [Kouleothrix aurantiaca]
MTTVLPTPIARPIIARPIAFQEKMVQAYQKRRKTQTRRTRGLTDINRDPDAWYPTIMSVFLDRFAVTFQHRTQDTTRIVFCPYGKPGDALWVRETYLVNAFNELLYRADFEGYETSGMGWKGGRFMPRTASRYTLPITDIRCERVQDITEADAQCEGWDFSNLNLRESYDPVTMTKAREWFLKKWDEINAKRELGWKHNPWVWAVSFPAYAGSPCAS